MDQATRPATTRAVQLKGNEVKKRLVERIWGSADVVVGIGALFIANHWDSISGVIVAAAVLGVALGIAKVQGKEQHVAACKEVGR